MGEPKFEPQMTTKSSYAADEMDLYNQFIKLGYGESVAKAVAYNFTQYMLGYLTREGVARYLVDAGATPPVASRLADSFEQVRNGIFDVEPDARTSRTDDEKPRQHAHV